MHYLKSGDVGISLKTQELYALVFLTRYLDLVTSFISIYNSVMKVVFISSSIAIVWCMRGHPLVRRTYDKDLDTFRHYILVLGSFLLALIFHDEFTVREVLKTFMIHGGVHTCFSNFVELLLFFLSLFGKYFLVSNLKDQKPFILSFIFMLSVTISCLFVLVYSFLSSCNCLFGSLTMALLDSINI